MAYLTGPYLFWSLVNKPCMNASLVRTVIPVATTGLTTTLSHVFLRVHSARIRCIAHRSYVDEAGRVSRSCPKTTGKAADARKP